MLSYYLRKFGRELLVFARRMAFTMSFLIIGMLIGRLIAEINVKSAGNYDRTMGLTLSVKSVDECIRHIAENNLFLITASPEEFCSNKWIESLQKHFELRTRLRELDSQIKIPEPTGMTVLKLSTTGQLSFPIYEVDGGQLYHASDASITKNLFKVTPPKVMTGYGKVQYGIDHNKSFFENAEIARIKFMGY